MDSGKRRGYTPILLGAAGKVSVKVRGLLKTRPDDCPRLRRVKNQLVCEAGCGQRFPNARTSCRSLRSSWMKAPFFGWDPPAI